LVAALGAQDRREMGFHASLSPEHLVKTWTLSP